MAVPHYQGIGLLGEVAGAVEAVGGGVPPGIGHLGLADEVPGRRVGEGPDPPIRLGLADDPPLCVELVAEEGDVPGIRDGEQAMVGIVGVPGDSSCGICHRLQAPLGVIGVLNRSAQGIRDAINPEVGARVAEGELASSGLGEGRHPALAVPGNEHRIPIAVTLAHQDAVACPEAPGSIVVQEAQVRSTSRAHEILRWNK